MGGEEEGEEAARPAAHLQNGTEDGSGASSNNSTNLTQRCVRPRISFHKPKPVSPSSRIFLPSLEKTVAKRVLNLDGGGEDDNENGTPAEKKRRREELQFGEDGAHMGCAENEM